MNGNAATAAPRKLCALDRHLMLASSDICHGCWMEFADLYAQDRRAKDLEVGRDDTSAADEETYGQDD